jgi:hypothetical protein
MKFLKWLTIAVIAVMFVISGNIRPLAKPKKKE